VFVSSCGTRYWNSYVFHDLVRAADGEDVREHQRMADAFQSEHVFRLAFLEQRRLMMP
jgi:hypothetical protein